MINSSSPQEPSDSAPEEKGFRAVNRNLATRWGGYDSFFQKGAEAKDSTGFGFVGVPQVFLRLYSQLEPEGLDTAEAMLVIQLMNWKWTAAAPWPSYSTLAKHMGVTNKTVQRCAANLEKKGFLIRTGRSGFTNEFNLSGLFKALDTAVGKEAQKTKLPPP